MNGKQFKINIEEQKLNKRSSGKMKPRDDATQGLQDRVRLKHTLQYTSHLTSGSV